MIVLVGGVKGGSGRSTTATNLAVWLAHEGHKFALLDTDKQRSASKWASRRDERRATNAQLPMVFCPEKRGDGVAQFARDLEEQFGIVIIDGGGRDSAELRASMSVADKMIVPMAPSQLDLETLEDLAPVLDQARGFNPSLVPLLVITKAERGRARDELLEAREALADYPGFELSKNVLSYYKVYRTAIAEGVGVVEEKNMKAKAELQLLAQEIFA